MKLGRQSLYAIDGLLVLAAKPVGTVMLLRDIARSRHVPESFLAKIFQIRRRGMTGVDKKITMLLGHLRAAKR